MMKETEFNHLPEGVSLSYVRAFLKWLRICQCGIVSHDVDYFNQNWMIDDMKFSTDGVLVSQ